MITLVLTLLVFSTLASAAVKRVPAGQVHSLYRKGKAFRLLQPGTHFVVPLVDRVGHRIDLGGRTLRFDEASCPLQGVVYWQVLEPERADEVIEQADQLIRHRVLEVISNEAADQAEPRREVAARVKSRLNQQLRERGFMVTRVELEAA